MEKLGDFLSNERTPYFVKVRELLNDGKFIEFIKYIQFSTKKIIELFQKGIVTELCKVPLNAKDDSQADIISTVLLAIFTQLNNIGYNFLPELSIEDKLNACKNRDSSVIILMFAGDEIIENTNVEDPSSPIHQILMRDDPFLLEKCLDTRGELFSASPNLGVDILFYSVKMNLRVILDNFFIFIDYFGISDDDLTDAVSIWKFVRPGSPLPNFLKMHYDAILNYEAKELFPTTQESVHKVHSESWFIESPKHTIDNLAHEYLSLKASLNNTGKTTLDNQLDGTEDSLCDLPYFLMNNPEALINHDIYLSYGPVGIGKGSGEGMFKTLVQKYFEYIEEKKVFVNPENSPYCLPTNEIINDPKKLNEYRAIFYGFGVVYLKCLLSKIPFTFNMVPHIWVFQSLLGKDIGNVTNREEQNMLIKEAIQYDPICAKNIFESMYIDFQKEELTKQFDENMISINHRGEFLVLIGKGFRLEYVDKLIPIELKDQLENSRKLLSEQFAAISRSSPEAIRTCLVGVGKIPTDKILAMFEFENVDDLQRYEDDRVHEQRELRKNDRYLKKMEKTKEIIKNCIIKWANSPDPTMINEFFEYTVGVKKFSPYSLEKWKIFITKNVGEKYKNKIPENVRAFRVWSCSNEIMSSIFLSEEEFESYFKEFYLQNKKQGNYLFDGNQ